MGGAKRNPGSEPQRGKAPDGAVVHEGVITLGSASLHPWATILRRFAAQRL